MLVHGYHSHAAPSLQFGGNTQIASLPLRTAISALTEALQRIKVARGMPFWEPTTRPSSRRPATEVLVVLAERG
jgi:hypothetical protein